VVGLTVRPVAVEQTRALRQAVLRPYLTVEQMIESEPTKAFAAGAFEDDRLVAVGLIGAEGEPGAWRIRGMAAAPELRGRGAGSAVLESLLEHARAQGGSRAWASVRIPARTLYERAGFVTISDEYEEPKIGPHVLMSLDL
jgi:ribosomal protein S18 acetylase RimI-like enzyme